MAVVSCDGVRAFALVALRTGVEVKGVAGDVSLTGAVSLGLDVAVFCFVCERVCIEAILVALGCFFVLCLLCCVLCKSCACVVFVLRF